MAILEWVKSGSTGTAQDFKITENGTFETDSFPSESEFIIVNAAAYDADGEIVTASIGTVTISSSPIKGQWLEETSQGVNVITLAGAGAVATYSMPLYLGPVIGVKAVIADVDFAVEVDHIKVKVWGK